jgi:hypothetical protein
VPTRLPQGSRYYGRLPVASRFVRLVFVPHRGPVDREGEDSASATAAKPPKKRSTSARRRS